MTLRKVRESISVVVSYMVCSNLLKQPRETITLVILVTTPLSLILKCVVDICVYAPRICTPFCGKKTF